MYTKVVLEMIKMILMTLKSLPNMHLGVVLETVI